MRRQPFPPYPILGEEERRAVLEVLQEGRLSTFIASPGEHFLGGPRIRKFEEEFALYHGVRYAVAFNSGTAALHAAVVAVGVEPGQEVVTSPYTFTASATCALMHNAIPVFSDVERDTLCLDAAILEKSLSPLTRAIIAVHLFGQPSALSAILDLARRHGLKVIEDCAQAPGARYQGKPVGIWGDCGVFSFQESKNMMTGEGGMLITHDERVADIARLIRNHGEAVVHASPRTYSSETLGYNYRMTEFEAAIGRCQLRRLDEWNAVRQQLASQLTGRLSGIPYLLPPKVREGTSHVYYVYPLLYDDPELPRDVFARALSAEGIPVGEGYVRPLYLSPLFQDRKAFAFRHYRGHASYKPGLCPVAEELYVRRLLLFSVVRPPATPRDMDDIAAAVEKVVSSREVLLARHREEQKKSPGREKRAPV